MSSYRTEVDGLRAFAVLSVVVYHAFPAVLPGGFVGVDVFFVISGFLISRILMAEFDAGRFRFATFFMRRIRRIFPALVVVLFATLAVGWFVLLADEYAQLGKHSLAGAGFVANLVLWWEVGYFDGDADTKPLLHLWSLGVEEQFYILWPLALWCAYRLGLSVVLILVVGSALSFAFSAFALSSAPSLVFFWPLGRFWELLVGGLLAWVSLRDTRWQVWTRQAATVASSGFAGRAWGAAQSPSAVAAVGLLVLCVSVIAIDAHQPFPGALAALPVFGAALIIAAGPRAWVNRQLLSHPVAVFFGLISYPLYLWHWPVLSLLKTVDGEPVPSQVMAAVALSVALAYATFRWIERPFRFELSAPRAVASLVVAMLCVAALGAGVWHRDGFIERTAQYERIRGAIGDWDFPNGLQRHDTDNHHYHVAGEGAVEIVLFGDSRLEQYNPRIKKLAAQPGAPAVAFVTGGGCAPIPGVNEDKHVGCLPRFETLATVLAQHPVASVVIGGAFMGYLNPRQPGGRFDYYFRDTDGSRHALTEDTGVALAREAFSRFVTSLATRYRVYVLLDIPSGEGFSPKSHLGGETGERPLMVANISVPREYTFPLDLAHSALEGEMKALLSGSGAKVLSQSDRVCPNGLCQAFAADGRPIYKDAGHMRPFFVLDRMDTLDRVFQSQ